VINPCKGATLLRPLMDKDTPTLEKGIPWAIGPQQKNGLQITFMMSLFNQ
jgi:hypothetical protein